MWIRQLNLDRSCKLRRMLESSNKNIRKNYFYFVWGIKNEEKIYR